MEPQKRKSVYLETTIPSLITARPSRDVITASRQDILMDEDVIDKRAISEFETREQNGGAAFVDAEEILQQVAYA